MILAVVTPVTAFLIAGSPIMSAIPAIIPCIMAGNALLVLGVGLVYKRKQRISESSREWLWVPRQRRFLWVWSFR